MPAILGTIDIQDDATPKVKAFKDALSDLLLTQQQVTQGAAGLSGGINSSISALGSVASATRAAAAGLQQVAEAQQEVAVASQQSAAATLQANQQIAQSGNALGASIQTLVSHFEVYAERLAATREQALQITGVLTQLIAAARAGTAPLQAQADAMAALTEAARGGAGGLAEHVDLLQQWADQLRAGVPLTAEQQTQLEGLTRSYAEANREALGLMSATEQLVLEQRASAAAAQETATGFGVLASQLREGATVSQLQKDALSELADAAQSLQGVSQADRDALAALNEQIRAGAQITPEQADAIQRLNGVLQENAGVTRDSASAIEELIRAEQRQMELTRQQAQAAEILERQMQEGSTVTAEQKAAMDELNRAMQENPRVTEKTRQTMEGLTYALDIGQKVGRQHHAALRQVSAGMQEAQGAAKEATSSLTVFRGEAALLATALGALTAGLYSYLRGSADVAARNEVLSTVLGIVATNAHNSEVAMATQVERVKALGITTSAATQSVLDFAQAELKVADSAKIARAAQDLAVIANTNSSEAFQRLTAAIQLQQPRLLRQFGIMTNLDAVYRSYATTVNKSVKELDTFDKRQAFINVILEEAQKAAGAYEASMNDVGKQMNSLARLTEEARAAIGEHLLPVMRLVVGTITDLLKAFDQADRETKVWVTSLLSAAAAAASVAAAIAGARFLGVITSFRTVGVAIKGVIELLIAVPRHVGTMITALRGVGTAVGAAQLALPFVETTKAASGATGAMGLLRTAVLALFTVIKNHPVGLIVTAIALATGAFIKMKNSGVESADALRSQFAKAQGKIDEITDAIKRAEDARNRFAAMEKNTRPGDALGQSLLAGRYEEFRKAMDALRKLVPGVRMAFDEATGTFKVHAAEVDAATKKYEAAQEALRGKIQEALADVTREIGELDDQLDALNTRLRIAQEAGGDAGKAMELLRKELDQNKDAVLGQTGVWQDLWTIIKNSVLNSFVLLQEGIDRVGKVLLWLGAIIRDLVVKGLRLLRDELKDIIPAPLLAMLTALAEAVEGISVDSLHEFASATTVMTDRTKAGTAALKSEINERERARVALENQRAEMEKLGREATKHGGTDALRRDAMLDAQGELYKGLDTEAQRLKLNQEIASAGLSKLLEQLQTGKMLVKEWQGGKLIDVERDMAPDDVRRTLSSLMDQLTEWRAKNEKESEQNAKRMRAAYENAFKGFMGIDEEMGAKMRALNDALKKTAGDAETYRGVLERGRQTIAAFNKLTDDQKKGLDAIAAAAQELERIDLEKWFREWGEEAQKGMLAARMAADELVGNLQEQFRADQLATNADIARTRRELNEQIFQMDRDLYEQQVVSKMTAVDQAIYQERRRVEDLKRQLAIERAEREENFKLEEQQLKLRMDAERKQLLLTTQRIRESMNLRAAEAEFNIRMLQQEGKLTELQAQNRIDGINEARKALNEHLFSIEQAGLKEIDREQRKQEQLLDLRRRAAAENDALMDQAVERQVANSNRLVEEIKRAFDPLRQLGIAVFEGVVEAFTSGLGKMIEGAKSFKEVLTDIWQGIKNTLLSFFSQILQAWLQNMAKMAAAKFFGGAVSGVVGGPMGGLGGILKGGLGSALGMGGGTALAGAPGTVTSGIPNMSGIGVGGINPMTGTAATPWYSTALGGGAIGAGVGGLVGYGVGSKTGSYGAGIGAGAASGFATGMMFGGPVGGLIGAGVGAVAGYFGAKKEREEAEKLRNEYLKLKGGIGELDESLKQLGITSDKLKTAKTVEDVGKAIKEIEDATAIHRLITNLERAHGGFEQLARKAELAGISLEKIRKGGMTLEETAKEVELVASKLELIDQAGGITRARQQAQLLGFDLQKALDAGTIEEFNAEMEQLNMLLEQQRKRLEAMGRIWEGLSKRLQGEAAFIQKSFESIFPKEGQLDKFFEAFKKAREKGFAGSAADFAASGQFKVSAEQLARIQDHVARAQASFDRLGLVAASTFAAMVKETGDWVGAMEAAGPTIDALIEMQDRLGLKASGAVEQLLSLRRTIKANQDVADSLSGITQILNGLGEAGLANSEILNAMGADAAAQLQILQERGVGSREQLLLMQPTLQALYEAWKNSGVAIDEATQNLINWGIQNGVVGDQFQSVQQKTLDILVIIAKTLGADIPAALDTTARAAENFGTTVGGAAGGAMDKFAQWQAQMDQMDAELTAQWPTWREEINQVGAAGDAARQRFFDWLQTHREMNDELPGDFDDWNRGCWKVRDAAGGAKDGFSEWLEKHREMNGQIPGDLRDWAGKVGGVEGATEDARIEFRRWLDEFHRMQQSNLPTKIGDIGDAVQGVRRRLKEATGTWKEFERAAIEAGRAAEDAATGAAEGHSPTGIKQIVVRLEEATRAAQVFGDYAVRRFRDIEANAAQLRMTGTTVETYAPATTISEQPQVVAGSGPVTVQVYNQNSFDVSTLTSEHMDDAWDRHLRPRLERAMETNSHQIAERAERAANRHRRR